LSLFIRINLENDINLLVRFDIFTLGCVCANYCEITSFFEANLARSKVISSIFAIFSCFSFALN